MAIIKKSVKKKTIKKKTKVNKLIPNRKAFLKRLEVLTKQIVIKRDGSYCCKTGFRIEGCNRHLHHIIARSRCKRLTWEPDNCMLLSMREHLYVAHKDVLGFAEWFNEKYPGRYEILKIAESNLPKGRITDVELLEIKDKLEKQLDNM